jgi:hypothetical protein
MFSLYATRTTKTLGCQEQVVKIKWLTMDPILKLVFEPQTQILAFNNFSLRTFFLFFFIYVAYLIFNYIKKSS